METKTEKQRKRGQKERNREKRRIKEMKCKHV